MTNRKASDDSLENGKTQLDKLLKSTTTPDEVREQALSQMAVCLESLCDGDVKPVVEAYDQLLKKFPDSHYAPWAKHRLEELKKPATGEFYAWFRKAKPAPPERPKPQDVKPSDLPNIKLTPDEGDPLPPSSSGTTPATPETKPVEGSTPAPEAPAVEGTPAKPEAPATEAKPAETPADPPAEKPADPPAAEAAKPAEAATEKPAEPAAEAPQP